MNYVEVDDYLGVEWQTSLSLCNILHLNIDSQHFNIVLSDVKKNVWHPFLIKSIKFYLLFFHRYKCYCYDKCYCHWNYKCKIKSKCYFFYTFRDLCTTFEASILPLVDKEPITGLLTKGRRSKANKCKTLSTWATKEIRKLKNAAQSW